jgi:hypothetical protein
MRWAVNVAGMKVRRMHAGYLWGSQKTPLGRPRRMWSDVIRIGLREIGWDDMSLIDQAQDKDQCRALVNTVMNFRVQ